MQTLFKGAVAACTPMLLLSVNQTILFALSMVVIAGLIGGAGLGDVVTSGLYSNPALAMLAGAAIVIMAIALDRATEAMANRTDLAHRHLTEGNEAAPPLHARLRGRRRPRGRAWQCARRRQRLEAVGRVNRGCSGRFRARSTTCRTRHVHLPHHEPDRELHRPVRARAAAQLLRRGAVAGDDLRARVDRVPALGSAARRS